MSGAEPILTPDCPFCGMPPAMPAPVLVPLCTNEECRVIQWDPFMTIAANRANASEVELPEWLGEFDQGGTDQGPIPK